MHITISCSIKAQYILQSAINIKPGSAVQKNLPETLKLPELQEWETANTMDGTKHS